MLTSYPSAGKKKALKICQVFAEGAGGRCAEPGCDSLYQGAAAFYGMTEHTLPLIQRCQREGRRWIYIDNAYYFGRGTHYRATVNRIMHDGAGGYSHDRMRALGVTVKDWRQGSKILITTQSELFYSFRLGISRQSWIDQVTRELRKHTDRPIEVCHKPAAGDMAPTDPHSRAFEPMLGDAWCMVTHSSSTAVKALADGVPVIWLGAGPDYSTGACVARTRLADVEDPYFPDDREDWIATLCANQWTLEEFANGRAWSDLQREGGRHA